MAEVAIVAPRGDLHAAQVLRRLRERGTTACLLDTGRLPTSARCSARLDGHQVSAAYDGLDLAKVRTFWLRRCHPPSPPAHFGAADRAFAFTNSMCFAYSLANLGTGFWVNPVDRLADQDGGNGKLRQLRVAAEQGLATPRTLFTNDPSEAQRFRDEVGDCVVKPMRSTAERPTYVEVANGDMEWLAATPHILQERVAKAFEVRVVTAGLRAMATEIHSQTSERSKVDFRLDYDVPHRPHELPSRVRRELFGLQAKLGLVFGVHDLIVMPDGRYIYLETNQQGQFLWLQQKTGQDYVGMVADFLRSGDPSFE